MARRTQKVVGSIDGFRIRTTSDSEFEHYIIADDFKNPPTVSIEQWGTIHMKRFLTVREMNEFVTRLMSGNESLPGTT